MSRIRQLHLYLGCIFTPLLIFFAVTGACQTFCQDKKVGKAPLILQQLSSVHKYQTFPVHLGRPKASVPFHCFVLAMAMGFVATAILGVVMAFKSTRTRWIVWTCLMGGVVLPMLLLYLGGGIN